MIKLQDFARQQGVTDRAVQKHLNTYAEELEGLYERKGPNGTWLTDEACEILRSKMKQQPITIMETSEVEQELRRKLEDKQTKIELLQGFLLDAKDEIKALTDEKYALQAENSKTKLLEAQNGDLSRQLDEQGKHLQEAKETARRASQEAEELRRANEEKDRELEELKSRKWYQLLFKKDR